MELRHELQRIFHTRTLEEWNTREVLAELDLTPDQLDGLAGEKVI